jgi:hypothetical protein
MGTRNRGGSKPPAAAPEDPRALAVRALAGDRRGDGLTMIASIAQRTKGVGWAILHLADVIRQAMEPVPMLESEFIGSRESAPLSVAVDAPPGSVIVARVDMRRALRDDENNLLDERALREAFPDHKVCVVHGVDELVVTRPYDPDLDRLLDELATEPFLATPDVTKRAKEIVAKRGGTE